MSATWLRIFALQEVCSGWYACCYRIFPVFSLNSKVITTFVRVFFIDLRRQNKFLTFKDVKCDIFERLRWSGGSVLAFSTQVRRFKPGRSRRIFKGEKILSTPSFGGEVKPSVPCRIFAASLNGVEVVISAKLPDNILAHSSTFRR